jgi:hypothetical protein
MAVTELRFKPHTRTGIETGEIGSFSVHLSQNEVY